MKSLNSFIKLFIFSIIIGNHTSLHAEKIVGGVINEDVRWNEAEGPYLLEKDLLITEKGSLQITPGTIIIVADKPKHDPSIPQLDKNDSFTVAIKVLGTIICSGTPTKRITIQPFTSSINQAPWYGIRLKNLPNELSEITFTDITGAYRAIWVLNSPITIRNCILEYNHVGMVSDSGSIPHVYNNLIASNFSFGIIVNKSNPEINNCIIVNNRNNGLWCDGESKVNFQYNCLFGNGDGEIADCDPELGNLLSGKKQKDSVDIYFNLFRNPIFKNSYADSLAHIKDTKIPTHKNIHPEHDTETHVDSSKSSTQKKNNSKYTLSTYSPCINNGNPSSKFKDIDGSRADIGIYGGPVFMAVSYNQDLLTPLKNTLSSHKNASGHGEVKKSSSHGAKKSEGHGAKKSSGGHGAKKSSGGHGEKKKSSGGHGAKKKGGH